MKSKKIQSLANKFLPLYDDIFLCVFKEEDRWGELIEDIDKLKRIDNKFKGWCKSQNINLKKRIVDAELPHRFTRDRECLIIIDMLADQRDFDPENELNNPYFHPRDITFNLIKKEEMD